MKEKILEKIKDLGKDSGFLLTITMINNDKMDDKVDTYLFRNKFPKEELDETKKVINKLIEEQKNK